MKSTSSILVLLCLVGSAVSFGEWFWVGGSTGINQQPIYTGNSTAKAIISARESPLSWIDSQNNVYIYGGLGWDSNSSFGGLSDFWKWNGNNSWSFLGGSMIRNPSPSYGTLSVPSPSNSPGTRSGATSWVDESDKLWLFGGDGELNDMWYWDGSAWVWAAGSNQTNQYGMYGTQGVPSTMNYPGARSGASSWYDKVNRILWIFGGAGKAINGTSTGSLNDLWQYSGGSWTWVAGSNTINQPGVYETIGVANSSNTPGARSGACSWMDAQGNLWLFGGLGKAVFAGQGLLQDIWKFDTTTLQWTFEAGISAANQPGGYGVQGYGGASNIPGSRTSCQCWTLKGNLWLFGGYGFDNATIGNLNDLWEFDTNSRLWTWVSGAPDGNQIGSYVNNGFGYPGARQSSASWVSNSMLYIFGGFGFGTSASGQLSDVWNFQLKNVTVTTGLFTTGRMTTGRATSTTSSSSSSSNGSGTSESATTAVASSPGSTTTGNGWKIAVGVVVGLIAIVIIAIFIFMCTQSRKRSYSFSQEMRDKNPRSQARGDSQVSLDRD